MNTISDNTAGMRPKQQPRTPGTIEVSVELYTGLLRDRDRLVKTCRTLIPCAKIAQEMLEAIAKTGEADKIKQVVELGEKFLKDADA